MFRNKLAGETLNKYWLHLIGNLLFFILIAYLLPIRFDTNDDATMLLIASGAYTGEPDAHLVYMNYIYGWFLTLLYSNISGVEWYTICLSAIHVISLSILTWRLACSNINKIWKLLGVIILYLLEIQLVAKFQYTPTAALCGTAAIVLFLTGSSIHRYLAAMLFLLATMIRLDPAYLSLLILLPLLTYFIFAQKNKLKILLPLSLFIALPIGAMFIDKAIYNNNPAWKEYKEFNYYRGRISDNPNSSKLTSTPSSLGEYDFYLLKAFFPDGKAIANENVKEAYELIKNVSFSQKIENSYNESASYFNLILYKDLLLLLLFWGIYLFIVQSDRRKKWLMLSTAFIFILSLFYVTLEAFLWPRVLFSAMIPYCVVVVYVCSSLEKKWTLRITAVLLLATVLLLEGGFLYKQKRENRRYEKMREPTIHEVDIASTEGAFRRAKELLKDGECLVNFGPALKIEKFSPFSLSEYYKNNRFLILSWLAKSPLNEGVLDSYQSLIGKNIICMEKRNMKEDLLHLKNSIQNNYGVQVEEDILHEEQGNILFRLKVID